LEILIKNKTIMITVIICAVALFVLGFIGMYKEDEDIVLCILGGLFIACFGALFGTMIALIVPSVTEKSVDVIGLASLQDGGSLSGSFFLGCGIIDQEMKYTYYYESDGGYRMGQKDVDDVLIKFTKDKPRIEIHKRKQTDALINRFSIIMNPAKYIFFIPEGSIKQNYKLDAQ